MKVLVRQESGYELAVEGIGLSFGVSDKDRLYRVADKLAPRDGGHNKFLESMQVWIEVTAARYWWAEADTYRVGTTKQSESTIHTICRTKLSQSNFEHPIYQLTLDYVNTLIDDYNDCQYEDGRKTIFELIKANLPEGYLQKRIICTNYKVLKNMFSQRKNHRLAEWHTFIEQVLSQVDHPEFLESVLK